MPEIAFSGEDELSEALARKCVQDRLPEFAFMSWRPAQGGRGAVEAKFASYAETAHHVYLIVMLDLDSAACPPSVRSDLLQSSGVLVLPDKMVLSIVAREAEAWVLGDSERLANFLSVPKASIPVAPESLPRPKEELLRLAGRSNQRLKQELCPRPGTAAKVGPGYNSVLGRFVQDCWRPQVASERCVTLKRTLSRLSALTGGR